MSHDRNGRAALEREVQIAQGLITWPEVAIICSKDDMRGIAAATALRRQHVITETYFSGNRKKQLQKAASADADLALFVGDTLELKDMFDGKQWVINSLDEVLPAIVAQWAWQPEESRP